MTKLLISENLQITHRAVYSWYGITKRPLLGKKMFFLHSINIIENINGFPAVNQPMIEMKMEINQYLIWKCFLLIYEYKVYMSTPWLKR